MINTNMDALGIIFPNSYDGQVTELVNERLMASIPFASRYRMIDFSLSGMVNSGIDNVSIIVRKNYHSLLRHLGSGNAWDLARKNGGLNIVPPYAQKTMKVYNGRVEALAGILDFLKMQKEKYVIISDANIAANFDFKAMLNAHIKSGADVTIVYKEEEIPYGFLNLQMTTSSSLYYSLDVADGRVTDIHINPKESGKQNLSMNIYLIDRELLIREITNAYRHGYIYFERDILGPRLHEMKVCGYRFDGYSARISDVKSYYDENMKLLDDTCLDALFGSSPIYTRIRDDNPTRYIGNVKVKNTMTADGCVIEGEVENCILFRGVRIGKGAVVKNCVIMQDTVIEGNTIVKYLITDKEVRITSGKSLIGNESFPVFVPARKIV